MINFIVCEDSEQFAEKTKTVVDNFMMNYDIDYSYKRFKQYDQKFKSEVVKDNGFKVYILDIETSSGSGIEATRYIREEIDDWNSIIIIMTVHNEYKYEALGNRLFLFDFISKFDNCAARLKEDLVRIMKNYGSRDKCLCYKYNGIIKRIDFKQIVTIEKEKDSKKCIVKTAYNDELISGTIKLIHKKLDNRFIKISRSIIANIDFIKSYDTKDNKLVYKNGVVSYDTSRENRKEVAKRVGNSL